VTGVPLLGCVFAESRAEALQAACGTIDLVACPECSHIYNRGFEPERIGYTLGYENSLGYSARYSDYLSATAERLLRTYELRRKSIIEIGCGSADLLTLLCGQGGNHGVGYDPSQKNRHERTGDGSVEVRSLSFSEMDAAPVDFVCSKHVLEHLSEMQTALQQARSILREGGAGYFEVPNGLAVLRERRIWDLTYEHISYFSTRSLHRALSDAGFAVARVGSSFGGQYLFAEVLAVERDAAASCLPAEDVEAPGDFENSFGAILTQWKDRIANMTAEGSRVALWGAGVKATGFLNMLGIGSEDGVEYVVDINPKKTGRFMPGTAQEIVTPEQLRHYRPDTVIVMNPEYLGEIRTKLQSVGVECELLIASGDVATAGSQVGAL
jgi:SAM-dependent methyltransferase